MTTQCHRPNIFQTVTTVSSYNISVKYKKFVSSDGKDKGILKSGFIAGLNFFSRNSNFEKCCRFSCLKNSKDKGLLKCVISKSQ